MQGRNSDADVENGCVENTEGQVGEGGMNWEIQIGIYTLPCVKWIASGKLRIAQGAQFGAL